MRTQRRYQRYYRRGTHNTTIVTLGEIRKENETQETMLNNTSHVIELKIR